MQPVVYANEWCWGAPPVQARKRATYGQHASAIAASGAVKGHRVVRRVGDFNEGVTGRRPMFSRED